METRYQSNLGTFYQGDSNLLLGKQLLKPEKSRTALLIFGNKPVSVSNFYGDDLRKKFRMNYLPEKVEIRNESFSGI